MYTTGTGEDFSQFGKYINVFADGGGFAGREIKLEGASEVLVSIPDDNSAWAHTNFLRIDGKHTAPAGEAAVSSSSSSTLSSSNAYSPSQNLVVLSAAFAQGKAWDAAANQPPYNNANVGTFDPITQVFTFNSDLQLPSPNDGASSEMRTYTPSYSTTPLEQRIPHCVIWCKPEGEGCNWYGVPIVLGINHSIDEIELTRYEFALISGDARASGDRVSAFHAVVPDVVKAAKFVGEDMPSDLVAIADDGVDGYGRFVVNNVLTVNVTPRGESAVFTVHSEYDAHGLDTYRSTGKITTGYDEYNRTLTVYVAHDATPTDSVYWEHLKIIVE